MDATAMSATAISRGLYERCLATQYSTNPVNYRVAPPTFAVTNKIGWHFDQSMRMNLDDKAKSLVPWYVDGDTVYDGTTNITMLTVTGVWAELEIGDHTNQFTGTPAIGTNPPIYGNYPWRIYVEDLEERYKVLNSMKMLSPITTVSAQERRKVAATHHWGTWNEAIALAEDAFLHADVYTNSGYVFGVDSWGWANTDLNGHITNYHPIIQYSVYTISGNVLNFNSNSIEVSVWIKGNYGANAYRAPTNNIVFDDNGTGLLLNQFVKCGTISTTSNSVSFIFGDEGYPIPIWCSAPVPGYGMVDRGYTISAAYFLSDYSPQFNYCTNKCW